MFWNATFSMEVLEKKLITYNLYYLRNKSFTMKYIYILLFFSIIISCKNGNSWQELSSNYDDEIDEEATYNDGTYCAEVSYYYSETGTIPHIL